MKEVPPVYENEIDPLDAPSSPRIVSQQDHLISNQIPPYKSRSPSGDERIGKGLLSPPIIPPSIEQGRQRGRLPGRSVSPADFDYNVTPSSDGVSSGKFS